MSRMSAAGRTPTARRLAGTRKETGGIGRVDPRHRSSGPEARGETRSAPQLSELPNLLTFQTPTSSQ